MNLFTALSALGALVAACAAWKSAIEIKKNTQALIMNSLLDAYASQEMLEAMIKLRSWKSQEGNDFADKFRRLRKTDYPKVEEIDRCRRIVSHYFQKVYALYKEGFLKENVVRAVATKGQVQFYREINEPLEAALNPNYDHSSFDKLAQLYDIPRYISHMANP